MRLTSKYWDSIFSKSVTYALRTSSKEQKKKNWRIRAQSAESPHGDGLAQPRVLHYLVLSSAIHPKLFNKNWQFYCFPNLLVSFASTNIYNGSVLSRLILQVKILHLHLAGIKWNSSFSFTSRCHLNFYWRSLFP